MPHRFVFVRHAQAVCNTLADDALIVSHDRESPLTESGRRQARALAERMSPALLGDAIFCSPMRRARETAEAIAQAHGLPLRIDPRLEEVRAERPFDPPIAQSVWDRLLERRIRDRDVEVHPGVEPLREQSGRVREFLAQRHRERAGESVTLVVSHAFTIELAMMALLGLAPDALESFRFRLSNTAVHVVENDGIGLPSRLLLVNAKNHLETWL